MSQSWREWQSRRRNPQRCINNGLARMWREDHETGIAARIGRFRRVRRPPEAPGNRPTLPHVAPVGAETWFASTTAHFCTIHGHFQPFFDGSSDANRAAEESWLRNGMMSRLDFGTISVGALGNTWSVGMLRKRSTVFRQQRERFTYIPSPSTNLWTKRRGL